MIGLIFILASIRKIEERAIKRTINLHENPWIHCNDRPKLFFAQTAAVHKYKKEHKYKKGTKLIKSSKWIVEDFATSGLLMRLLQDSLQIFSIVLFSLVPKKEQ